jgi:hypothetical protein
MVFDPVLGAGCCGAWLGLAFSSVAPRTWSVKSYAAWSHFKNQLEYDVLVLMFIISIRWLVQNLLWQVT